MKVRSVGDKVVSAEYILVGGEPRIRVAAGESRRIITVKRCGCLIEFEDSRCIDIDNTILDQFKTIPLPHPLESQRCRWAYDGRGRVLDWDGGECHKIMTTPGRPRVSCALTKREAREPLENVFQQAMKEVAHSARDFDTRINSSPEFNEWLES